MDKHVVEFVAVDYIIYPLIACAIFLYFNYRRRAVCFMGDVGSISLGYWMISLIVLLSIKTGEIKWLLLMVTTGVETGITLLERMRLKLNVFKPHRMFLFQLMVNENSMDHRLVSFIYSAIQVLVNLAVIFLPVNGYFLIFAVCALLSGLYIVGKKYARSGFADPAHYSNVH